MMDIHSAIAYGWDLKFVQDIVATNPESIHEKDELNQTPLMCAIGCGFLDIAQFLFWAGRQPDFEMYIDRDLNTVQYTAPEGGNVEIYKWVIEQNVLPFDDVLKIEVEGYTPLDCAISTGNLKNAQFLFEKCAQPNLENYCDGEWTPIHRAAKYGYTEILKWVFEKKVFHSLDVLKIKDDDQWTPLDRAIAGGNLETAQFLFEKGGRPNLEVYREWKWTPVHYSAAFRNILLWIFAEHVLPLSILHIKNYMGWTLMDCAILHGQLVVVQFLRNMGVRPNLELYRDGFLTPVHIAATEDNTVTLTWVFTEGVLPLHVLNIKDHMEMTPLENAIENRQQETIFLLRRLPIDLVFLAMQRAKRDHSSLLRRLPDELLDMVVDEVAARFRLKVEW